MTPTTARKVRAGLAVLVIAVSAALLPGAAAAANRPDFRDCAFAAELDPDFVKLTGANPSPQGTLMMAPTGKLQITASESADPGDSSGNDTLTATVSSPGLTTRSVSGSGPGKVSLMVPLTFVTPGRTYTISWMATFDNGNHMCPSSFTPANTSPQPFTVRVSGTPPAPPARPKPKRRCHKVTKRVHGHKKTVIVCHKRKKH